MVSPHPGSISLMEFFKLPLRAFCDGGFAGLVFVACRTADSPALQREFIENWRDIDNLTDRYLGVIIPSNEEVFIENYWFAEHNMKNDRIKGVHCATDGTRLTNQHHAARSIIRMDARAPLPREFVPPKNSGTVSLYEDSLTDAAKDTLEFFGISESLTPCTVIVSLLDKRTFVIQLGTAASVYKLLKEIMTRLEHTSTQCRALDSAVLAAQRERERLRASPYWAVKHHRAAAATAEWRNIKGRLVTDLETAAAGLSPASAELCRRMAARLYRDEPLKPDEWDDVHTLRRALSRVGTFGRLPRRLIRTIAKLNSGYPRTHDAVIRHDACLRKESELRTRIDALKSALTEYSHQLRLSEAVEAAAAEFNLVPSDRQGLLPQRMSLWPVTSLVSPGYPTAKRTTIRA